MKLENIDFLKKQENGEAKLCILARLWSSLSLVFVVFFLSMVASFHFAWLRFVLLRFALGRYMLHAFLGWPEPGVTCYMPFWGRPEPGSYM